MIIVSNLLIMSSLGTLQSVGIDLTHTPEFIPIVSQLAILIRDPVGRILQVRVIIYFSMNTN